MCHCPCPFTLWPHAPARCSFAGDLLSRWARDFKTCEREEDRVDLQIQMDGKPGLGSSMSNLRPVGRTSPLKGPLATSLTCLPWVLYLTMVSLISPSWIVALRYPDAAFLTSFQKGLGHTTLTFPQQLHWGHCLWVRTVMQANGVGLCFMVLNGCLPANTVRWALPPHEHWFISGFFLHKFKKCKQSLLYVVWILPYASHLPWSPMASFPLPCCHLNDKPQSTTRMHISSLPVELLPTQWLLEAKPKLWKNTAIQWNCN